MSRLSSPVGELKDHYEVVVVGSGYGGAIAASRLARAGREVCLLERGREFQPGEYPDTELEAVHQMQVDAPAAHSGSRTGLYDMRVNDGITVFQGCGLGGTSLINAGVCLRADPRVFADARWPAAIRKEGLEGLEAWFRRAEAMLRPQAYPEGLISVRKQLALEESATALGGKWYRPPIAVGFEDGINHVGVEQKACILCGDCMTGCNHSAKLTLIMNYLPDAKNHGAVMFTQIAVRSVQRTDDRWLVHYQLLGTGREKFNAPTMTVSAGIVVLSAGSLGTTEILLRSREAGLSLSDRLGHGFSGNGDVLGFGYDTEETINGIGFGHRDADGMSPVGPVITSVIDMRDTERMEEGVIVEEGAIAGALKPMLPPLFALAAKVVGKETVSGRLRGLQHAASEVPGLLLGAYHGAMHRTQTYLVMAHDSADGHMALEDGRLRIHWPTAGREEIIARVNKLLENATRANGGVYVKNPIWSDMLKHALVTVHPIGGSCMGDTAADGVVDDTGRVFAGGDGNAVHEGLYVLDGSIVPRAVGVNPLLTISALAERGVAALAAEHGWDVSYELAPPRPAAARPTTMGIEFTETMKGYFSSQEKDDFDRGATLGKEQDSSFAFTLTIITDDLQDMLNSSDHRARALGSVIAPALSREALTVTDGTFMLFVPDPDQVGLRRMRYLLKLSSDEGRTYFMDGFKLIQEEAWTHLWHATTTLYITIHEGDSVDGPVVGRGRLHIHPDDFLKQLTTMRVTDAPNLEKRLEAQARFGAYFGGTLFDTYGGIFARPNMFNPDAPPRKKRPLKAPTPELHHLSTKDGARLRLTRYRGGAKGPVLLVHGIAASSRVFTIDTVDPNLVEFLTAHGFDVWLLDWRGSPELRGQRASYTADDIAREDIPIAVAKVRELSGATDVQVVAHCVGAAALLMSLADGLEGVRSAVCVQFGLHVTAPSQAQLEEGLHLPSFLHGHQAKSMDPYVDTHSGWRSQVWEEAFRIRHLRDKEGCDSPVCHRLTYMYGLLFHHDNLNLGTHSALHEMFGAASVELFEQLQRWERTGHVVDASGAEAYLPHLDRLAIPITFIHGEDDRCVLADGTVATVAALRERNGVDLYQLHVVPRFGHLDSLVGKYVLRDIFPLILNQLQAASTKVVAAEA